MKNEPKRRASSAHPLALEQHVTALRACTICPKMHRPAVSGGPVLSKVITVGQAPGTKEPVLGRPFAWTAGAILLILGIAGFVPPLAPAENDPLRIAAGVGGAHLLGLLPVAPGLLVMRRELTAGSPD